MNRSIFRQFIFALFAGVLPLLLFMFFCSYIYFQRQKEVAIECFFRDSLQQIFWREKAYQDYEKLLSQGIDQEIQKFKRSTERKLKNVLAKLPSVEQLEKAHTEHNLAQFRDELAVYINLLYKSDLNNLQQTLLKNFSLLSEDGLGIQYINLLLILQFLHINGYLADEDYDEMAVVIKNTEQENQASTFSQIFIMLNNRRFFRKRQMDLSFIQPLLSIADLKIDIAQPSLQRISAFAVNYAIMISGLLANDQDGKAFFERFFQVLHTYQEPLDIVAEHERYYACIAINIASEELFKRLVLAQDFPVGNYRIFVPLEGKTAIDNLRYSSLEKPVQTRSELFSPHRALELSFLNPVNNRVDGVHLSSDLLADELKKRGIGKFICSDEKGTKFYGLALFDAEFAKFIHVLSISETDLLISMLWHLRFFAIVLLTMFFLIVIILFWGVRSITAPIFRLANLVSAAAEKIEVEPISNFHTFYIELELIRKSFQNKLNNLLRQFSLQKELLGLQEFLFQHSQKESILIYIQELYQRLFSLKINNLAIFHTRPKEHGSILEGKSKLSLESFGATELDHREHKKSELALFDEQIHFFFRQQELEQEYAGSVAERREFELACDIQQSLMSHNLPDDKVATFYQATRFLGGDFFDVRMTDTYGLYLIADVSGKGLPAALFAAMVKACFDAAWLRQENLRQESLRQGREFKPSLAEMFVQINDYTLQNPRKGFFCTAFLCYLDRIQQKLYYVSAGHNKMLVQRQQEIQELSARGFPFGFISGNYEELCLDMQAKDIVFLYTDGITEAEDGAKNLFGLERLQNILIAEHYASAKTAGEAVLNGVQGFIKGAEQSDDITYVTFTV